MPVSDNRDPALQTLGLRDSEVYQLGDPVALFVPCYVDQFYPHVAEATFRLLKKLGVAVVYAEGQTCCGQPAFNSGYWDEARKVVKHFCQVFEPYRWIVTPSGSCAAMCRVFFSQLDPSKEVMETGSRVYELTEFLVDILGWKEPRVSYPHKATLHIGCHTRRELNVVVQPTILLEAIQDLEICALPDQVDCCGFGGTFSVKMEALSLSMGRKKVDNIVRSGADTLVSTDMSCLMHLEGIMKETPEAHHIDVKHIAELLVASKGLSRNK